MRSAQTSSQRYLDLMISGPLIPSTSDDSALTMRSMASSCCEVARSTDSNILHKESNIVLAINPVLDRRLRLTFETYHEQKLKNNILIIKQDASFKHTFFVDSSASASFLALASSAKPSLDPEVAIFSMKCNKFAGGGMKEGPKKYVTWECNFNACCSSSVVKSAEP